MAKKERIIFLLRRVLRDDLGSAVLALLAVNIFIIVSVNLISKWLLPFQWAEITFGAYILVMFNFRLKGRATIWLANGLMILLAVVKIFSTKEVFLEESILAFYLYVLGFIQTFRESLK